MKKKYDYSYIHIGLLIIGDCRQIIMIRTETQNVSIKGNQGGIAKSKKLYSKFRYLGYYVSKIGQHLNYSEIE